MNLVKFEATRLQGTGKTGILTPDKDGYRTVVLGALNTLNSANQYYTMKGAEQLFLDSSTLMRRVRNGCLKIEVEHPKRLPGMTDDEYMERLLDIDINQVCGHIADLTLDPEFGKKNPQFNNPMMVGIIGSVRPSGVKASVLEEAFNNPRENVCFSIRSFTRNYKVGKRLYKELDTVVTFDLVNEGGIESASKWSSPTLESISQHNVTERMIRHIVERTPEVSLEDSRVVAHDVLKTIRGGKIQGQAPLYKNW